MGLSDLSGDTGRKLNMDIAAGAAVLVLVAASSAWAQNLSEVTNFGSNPGNLKMFKYVPEALPANSPLVVALHGCNQSASAYDDETGWVKLAEERDFALLLPQQQSANNPIQCFNWFEPGDIGRDRGEALSIKQMIDKMKQAHSIDPKQVFVTGLSAGGGMTSVMLAAYPEIFAGGAIIAGLPYMCATTPSEAFSCMNQGKNLTPATWGSRVRNASSHKGSWPKVSIWQGTTDTKVVPLNANELVDQWTNVHNIDRTADVQNTVNGHSHQVFKDANGNAQVEIYMISNMGHGTPISPGPGKEQCGITAPYILNAGICSSYYIAEFLGIKRDDPDPPSDYAKVSRKELLDQIENMRKNLDEIHTKIQSAESCQ